MWNEDSSYFSFGEWTRSSSSANPIISASMPSSCLKSCTTGIEPPMPTIAGVLPHSASSAAAPRCSIGQSSGTRKAGPMPWSWNSTSQSAGTRAFTNSLSAARCLAGSWSPTRRNDTLAEASEGITVLKPAPV